MHRQTLARRETTVRHAGTAWSHKLPRMTRMRGPEKCENGMIIFWPKRIEESDDARHGGVEEPETTTAQPLDIEEDINEDDIAELFMDDGNDLDSLNTKAEDAKIVYHTILGHDLTESYSNGRLQIARARHMVGQLAVVDMSEIFSPERVTKLCKSYGFEPGQAMDIQNGYNFDHADDRKRPWESVVRDKPKLIIGSPPCTFFSRLQELNKHMHRDNSAWMAKFHEGIEQAKRYVRFCISLYKHQLDHGWYFLHEHPWLATRWLMPEMQKMVNCEGVQTVRTDMCQFGMQSRTGGIGSQLGHVLKPTGFKPKVSSLPMS